MLRDRYPGVLLLALERNLGFGRAVNAGAARATGDAIVLVNNDVVVEPGFVAAITLAARRPVRRDGRGPHDDPGHRRRSTASGSSSTARSPRTTAARDAPPGRLAMPSGGAAAYRRSAFLGVGGFDERLFAYGEDVDLGAPAPRRRLGRRRGAGRARRPPRGRDRRCRLAAGSASSRVSRAASCCGAGASWRHGRRRARCSPRRWSSAGASYGTAPPCRCAPVSVAGAPPVGERRRLPDGVVDPAISWREALRRLASGR